MRCEYVDSWCATVSRICVITRRTSVTCFHVDPGLDDAQRFPRDQLSSTEPPWPRLPTTDNLPWSNGGQYLCLNQFFLISGDAPPLVLPLVFCCWVNNFKRVESKLEWLMDHKADHLFLKVFCDSSANCPCFQPMENKGCDWEIAILVDEKLPYLIHKSLFFWDWGRAFATRNMNAGKGRTWRSWNYWKPSNEPSATACCCRPIGERPICPWCVAAKYSTYILTRFPIETGRVSIGSVMSRATWLFRI